MSPHQEQIDRLSEVCLSIFLFLSTTSEGSYTDYKAFTLNYKQSPRSLGVSIKGTNQKAIITLGVSWICPVEELDLNKTPCTSTG